MDSPLFALSQTQLTLTLLLFCWTGFVRSGLGFGGAALGLPLMLFIIDQPIFWLPVIGLHLLFFSALTLRTRLNHIDWRYLRKTAIYIIPSALIGVFGLISLPNKWLLLFIYGITLVYACLWIGNISIRSNKAWVDKLLLTVGGYVAGTSLTGAPLIFAVYMHNVATNMLRNTLFVLWFVLVAIKMSAFIALDVPLNWQTSLILLPVAAIGHFLGLAAHEFMLRNDRAFKQIIGCFLALISILGLIQAW